MNSNLFNNICTLSDPLFHSRLCPTAGSFPSKSRHSTAIFCRRFPSRRRRRRDARSRENTKTTSTSTSSTSSADSKINVVIDVEEIRVSVSDTIESFVLSGTEAFQDLRSVVTMDAEKRVIVVGMRRSSLEFFGMVSLCGFCLVVVVRIWGRLGKWFWKRRSGGGIGNGRVVVRRDRSLGGKEVVIATRAEDRKSFNTVVNPLSVDSRVEMAQTVKDRRDLKTAKLPGWWPNSPNISAKSVVDQDAQLKANGIVRAIIDSRLAGRDFTYDDILQLRRACRWTGAKAFFVTANARDSLYRAAVKFVLDCCHNNKFQTPFVEIDGEKAPQFLAGLAYNIGLDVSQASNMVSASVAAHTRSLFLQAWALEIQGKRSEALQELQALCVVHHVFPPDELSPQMEMVSQGLGKHLSLEQREILYEMYMSICSPVCQRIAAEALGLVLESP